MPKYTGPVDGEEEQSEERGEKGKSFRGGGKKQRDNWYGYDDKDFQRWWHRVGKAQAGGRDIDNADDAREAWDAYVAAGKPKGL